MFELNFHTASMDNPVSLDEEIIIPFRRAPWDWIVVCETSVRRVLNGKEVENHGLSDVAVHAWVTGDTLVVIELGTDRWSFNWPGQD